MGNQDISGEKSQKLNHGNKKIEERQYVTNKKMGHVGYHVKLAELCSRQKYLSGLKSHK